MDAATAQVYSHATGYTGQQRPHDSWQGGNNAPQDESRSEVPQSTYSTHAHIAAATSLPRDGDEQAERRIRNALDQPVYRERQRLNKTTKSITPREDIVGNDKVKHSKARSGEPNDDFVDADGEQEAEPVVTSTDSTSMIAAIDANTSPVLPETWFRSEFRKSAAPWEQRYARADIHNTGAFTMWGPNLVKRPGNNRKFATDSSRLDKFIAGEERQQTKDALKFDQLIRHGLAAGHPDHLKPILAIPNCGPEEVVKRKKAAENLIDQYVYESSEDEASDQNQSKRSGSKPKKNRFTKLKQALARLERPSGLVDDDEYAALVEAQTAFVFATALSKGDRLPMLGFQRAMWKESNHPDFGMNFKEAVELAIAKEQQARIHAMPEDITGSEHGNESERSTPILPPLREGLKHSGHAPAARRRPQRSRTTDVDALPKYDIIAYTVTVWVANSFLHDFRDERLVFLYNQVMQEQDPSRPFRSQASLLEVSRTEPREYFGKDMAEPEESEPLAEGFKDCVTRLIAVLKSDHD